MADLENAPDAAESVELDPHIRPITFGLVELMFDLTFFSRELYGDDLDCALIVVCVCHATMRPFMEAVGHDTKMLCIQSPPEELRGSISRRMIAEKTGIARETVRRKVAMLIDDGLLIADDEDGVRIVPKLHDPRTRDLLESCHKAVMRYMALMQSYGVK